MDEAPRRGRPPIYASRMYKTVNVPLTEKQYKRVRTVAERSGKKLATVLRESAMRELRRNMADES